MFMRTKRTLKSLAVLLLLAGIFYACTAGEIDNNNPEENEECVEERKCECDFDDGDFDLSELNEENCLPCMGWVVGLTLKSDITDCPTENPKIKTLITKHDVTFEYSWGIYILRGKDCNMCYAEAVVRAFLATCLFEHVRVFGIVSPDHFLSNRVMTAEFETIKLY
jgi:hypothetical protein